MSQANRSLKEHILVVDQTPDRLRPLICLLVEKGYQVRFAPNEPLALKLVQAQLAHLILLTVKLPELDGYKICQALKANQRTRNLPVIFLGSRAAGLDSLKALAVGGGDCIAQPVQIEEIAARIEHQLHQQRLQRQLTTQITKQKLQLQQELAQRQQVEQVLEQQVRKNLLLEQVTAALRSQDSQTGFEAAVAWIGQVFQVNRAAIHIYVPPPIPEIPLVAEYVEPEYVSMRRIDFRLEDNLFMPKLLAQDQALAAVDVFRDPRLESLHSLCQLAEIKSLLAVRTSYQDQANGVIILQHCAQWRDWTADEIILIEAIAAQVGIALAQAKSVEQEEKQLEALGYQNLILRQEIRERRQVEAALQVSEAELRGLFAAMVDVILVLDRQGRYLRVASTNQENLYKPADELLGKTLHEVFPPAQADRFLAHIQTSLDSNQFTDFEYGLEIQGRKVWFNTKVSPISPDAVIWVARDITARKQAEAELLKKSTTLSDFSTNLKHLHRLSLTNFETIESLCADYLKTGCQILGFSSGIVGEIRVRRSNVGRSNRSDHSLDYLSRDPNDQPDHYLYNYSNQYLQHSNDYSDYRLSNDLSYRILTAHSDQPALTAGLEVALQDTYCCAVIQQRHTVYYEQASQRANHPALCIDLKTESYIGTPIWVDGDIFGTLSFFSTQPRPQGYTSHEPEIIELMAQSIGKFISEHQVKAKRQQAEEEVQLLLNITQAITEAPDFDQALYAALSALCAATGWIYGEVWLPAADETVLKCSPVWYCNQTGQSPAAIAAVKRLRQSLETTTFQPNQGIAGRVWSQHQPEWTTDAEGLEGLATDSTTSLAGDVSDWDDQVVIAGEQSQYRFQLVNQYGIKARLAVPIIMTKERSQPHSQSLDQSKAAMSPDGAQVTSQPIVLAVLVFSTVEARHLDERLIQLVSAVAAQLGTVLAQKQTEAELQTLFTAMNDMVLVRDATGRCLKVAAINPRFNQSAANWLGKTLDETLPQPVANQVLAGIQDSLTRQTIVNLECSLPLSSRDRHNLHPAIQPEAQLAGQPEADQEICLAVSISPLSDSTVLIVARDISDRKQVESALARRERYLAALVAVQRQLLAFQTQDSQYREILGILGRVAAVSRVYLYENYLDKAGNLLVYPCAAWAAEEFSTPVLPQDLYEHCPRWAELLAQGEVVSTDDSAFDSALETEQKLLKAQNVDSILVLPLTVNNAFWGFMGFDCTNQRTWDRLEISLLRTAASAIALHYERKLAENALRQSAEREQATLRVIERMRQTLDIAQIFRTTVEELQQLLKCDRVLIYRFNPDWSGEFVAESVAADWISVLPGTDLPNWIESPADVKLGGNCINGDIPGDAIHDPVGDMSDIATDEPCVVKTWSQATTAQSNYFVHDTYLRETQGGAYGQGAKYLCVRDVHQAGLTDCYLELLNRLQAKAYLTVPIFQGDRLWGLLANYQNAGPRDWQPSEIHLVIHISTQLGVALQQADLLAQTQQQSADLVKAKDAAEAANRAKTQFLAHMSHELRTPLNSILGFTQLISQDVTLSLEHQEHLDIVNRSGYHLLTLINEVLEVARLEANRTSLQSEPFDLYGLLENIEDMLRLTAAEKQLQFMIRVAPEVPRSIQTDKGKLRQVLLNLLDNAIKFTETGSVRLHVRLVEAADPARLLFSIIDTGYGIAAEEMNSLFEAFVQTEAGRQSHQGTGLGLVISRRFVQLMGGQLQVQSKIGKGSIFAFDLPVEPIIDLDSQTSAGLLDLPSLAQTETEPAGAEYLGVHCIYEHETHPFDYATHNGYTAYDSATHDSAAHDGLTQLTAADLADLPDGWICSLAEAATGCSDRQVLQLIQDVSTTHARLAQVLTDLAYNFQFEEIIDLTNQIR